MTAEMFTGALVSIFVERTIDTLASRFVHIFRARKHNKKRLNDLRTKLLAIDVVAYDAEQKQFRDSRVRDWLLRTKGVVFDAENLLDEIDYQLRKSQVEEESQSATNKVWNSLKSSFVNFSEIEIESRMKQVIEDLEYLITQGDLLGLKKGSGVGVGSGSENTVALTRQGIVRRLKNLEIKEKEKVGTQAFAINLADSEQTESRNVKKCRRNPERNTAAKTTSQTTAKQGSIFHGPTKKTTVENSTFPSKVGNGNVFENIETFFKTAREQHDEQGKALEQSQKDLKDSKDTIAQLKKRLEDTEKERDEDYAKLLRVNEDYEKCREKRREDQFSWEKKENEFAQEKAELCATVEEAKDAIARSFGDGFDAAIEQAKILFPAIDFSALDPMKEVVDGQIVDG
ncbi:HR1 rho-binding repeat [Vigna unguiculata]|uniref:HR1 rho-binding repeat n=1 Tax=Vigna unguiculata TaxID=3917 RepID=A0A4D6LAY2_VIGUN|nr:HR1 rho-binding repeat [Vigna unguiculata]